MSEEKLNTSVEEMDYASKYCADSEEELEIPHAELPPARKVICVVETIIMGALVYLSGEVLVEHTIHILHRSHIMYVVPWKFFLHLVLPFTK